MSKFIQYRIFVSIVEAGSISGAAKILNYSPPAISKQLVALERKINVQLFNRSHKKLHITEAGSIFYKKCKSILESIDKAESDLLSEQGEIEGPISITMSKALCRSAIFDLLASFAKQYPKIRFIINFSNNVEDLHEHNIDFAFRLGTLQDNSHLIATPLTNTQLVACATPDYIKLHGVPASLIDMKTGSLILMPPSAMSTDMRHFCKTEKLLFTEHNFHIGDDIEATYHSVKSGFCAGLMLDVSVRQELSEGSFVQLFKDKKFPRKKLYLIYKKKQWESRKQQVFKYFINKNVKKYIKSA